MLCIKKLLHAYDAILPQFHWHLKGFEGTIFFAGLNSATILTPFCKRRETCSTLSRKYMHIFGLSLDERPIIRKTEAIRALNCEDFGRGLAILADDISASLVDD